MAVIGVTAECLFALEGHEQRQDFLKTAPVGGEQGDSGVAMTFAVKVPPFLDYDHH